MRTLIRNGTVIDTAPLAVHPATDVLITDGRITALGPALTADDAETVDATGRYVLPGFVDTHRHTWQTALRGIAADADLGEYLHRVLGDIAPRVQPADIHAGTLAGALDAIDGGVTTLQDFSHALYTPDHADAAVSALRASGIRALFGYGRPVFGGTADHADVRRVHASMGGPLTMALAPHGPSYSPIETVEEDWALARELGVPLVVHVGAGPVAERPVEALRARGLLGPGILYVHGNSLPDAELKLIADSGGTASVAPAVEARMGHGAPVAARFRAAGVVTGLGVDVVTTVAGDMFALMRAAMLSLDASGGPRLDVGDTLRMATIDGARALGMANLVGSLAPGKRADLMLIRAGDVNLLGAVDPVAAVVTSAHPGNVEAVMVDGRFVKRDGRLEGVDLARLAGELRESAGRLGL
ncbi:amidohydrolase family protein [Phytomonospora sp. NPDC050363]|uniref:amidohydrolase family protein n=1 Tax=Phytomonospora sp. NPDC050363 TaxID=3155642 RepID=UPI00340FDCE3